MLEQNVWGEKNRATSDPNASVESQEFRKLVHRALKKTAVRIQEMKAGKNFEGQSWGRFVEGEEIDLRRNFGQTGKLGFWNSTQVQDKEGPPGVEDYCVQI